MVVPPSSTLERVLSLEIVRVTEAAAVGAAYKRGGGDEKAADQGAVDAMRSELNRLWIEGKIVIGEGERDEAPMLFIGEEVGRKEGQAIDIALDPLEGTTLCAKDQPNSIAVIAFAERGNLLNAPDVYMEKIAVGPGFEKGVVSLNKSPTENVEALAKAKGVKPSDIRCCVLDRPRHEKLIEELRQTGAPVRLIGDGDVVGIIHTTEPDISGVDLYMGTGGAPEGVLAAAALRCIGGQMEGRLILDDEEKLQRAKRMGIDDASKIYSTEEMAAGDVIFAATGVTDGNMLDGVRFLGGSIKTHTIVMRSSSGTVREIRATHKSGGRFQQP